MLTPVVPQVSAEAHLQDTDGYSQSAKDASLQAGVEPACCRLPAARSATAPPRAKRTSARVLVREQQVVSVHLVAVAAVRAVVSHAVL